MLNIKCLVSNYHLIKMIENVYAGNKVDYLHYKIILIYSNEFFYTYYDTLNKIIVFAFRGTIINNKADLYYDSLIISGKYDNSPRDMLF